MVSDGYAKRAAHGMLCGTLSKASRRQKSPLYREAARRIERADIYKGSRPKDAAFGMARTDGVNAENRIKAQSR